MKKLMFLSIFLAFLSSNSFAGCMKSEIKEIDAKLNSATLNSDQKDEVIALRKIVVANEHKNSELAFESYEKAMSILN